MAVGGGGEMNWEIGIDMYTLMCIKWMTNKNLLYKKVNKKKNRSNIVTNSTKTLKLVHIKRKKIFKKKTLVTKTSRKYLLCINSRLLCISYVSGTGQGLE